jgi:hypothetical protein
VKVSWKDLTKPIAGLKTDEENLIEVQRETIPIVFVPGIMGSRLKTVEQGTPAWKPDDPGFMIKTFGGFWVDGVDKQAILVGDTGTHESNYLTVFEDDVILNAKIDKETKTLMPRDGSDYGPASKRGWGGVFWGDGGYSNILKSLSTNAWSSTVETCFRLPVYACGFNWTASAREGGEWLAQRVNEIIAAAKKPCDKVILVTHSMGGLVARSACMSDGFAEKVLGVVHVVQPATGSPEAYWRIKAGFGRGFSWEKFAPREYEGFWGAMKSYALSPVRGVADSLLSFPSAWCLGTSGLEVAALLGHMPGGLQLLPNKSYETNTGGQGWLRLDDGDKSKSFPDRNPYDQIYRNQNPADLWRLILFKDYLTGKHQTPYQAKKAMKAEAALKAATASEAPNLALEGKPPADKPKSPVEKAWGDFIKCLKEAEDFHDKLGMKQHPNSFHIYGVDNTTADSIRLEVERRRFITSFLGLESIDDTGEFNCVFDYEARRDPHQITLTMDDPAGDGDGTVPRSSGMALITSEEKSTKIVGAGHDSVFAKSPRANADVARRIETLCMGMIEKAWKGT